MITHRTTVLAMTLCAALASHGQDWNAVPGGNVITTGTEYLGARAGSIVPLHLRTIPDLSIDFSTSDTLLMRLYPNQISVINTFTNLDQKGYLGLSGTPGFFATHVYGLFSRLHFVDDTGRKQRLRRPLPLDSGRGTRTDTRC